MARHTIKYTHKNGVELDEPEAWCGRSIEAMEWHFKDAQYLAWSAGGSIQPCRNCVKAIIKELEREL